MGIYYAFFRLAGYEHFLSQMIVLELLRAVLELLELLGKCVFITIGIMAIYGCFVDFLDKRKK